MRRLLMVGIIILAVTVAGSIPILAGTADVVKQKTEAAFREYLKAGNFLAGEGKYAAAAESYRRALGVNPQSAEAYSLLGSALDQAGKPREAEEALRKAVSLKPDFAEGYFHLGNFLKSQNRTSEAEEAFRKARQYQGR
jgi:tetratricopeptide (TPR) repeat protein